jgi:hypothetical protein
MLSGGSSVFVYVTSDSGATWQGPAALPAGSGNSIKTPWIAYAPAGALGVGYKIQSANSTFTFWAAVAPAGDTNFGAPVLLSSADSPVSPCGGTCDDFSNVTMDDTYLDAAWGDARDSSSDGHMESWFGRFNFASTQTVVGESPWSAGLELGAVAAGVVVLVGFRRRASNR